MHEEKLNQAQTDIAVVKTDITYIKKELAEIKEMLVANNDKQEARITSLERWRTGIVMVGSALIFIATFFKEEIKRFF